MILFEIELDEDKINCDIQNYWIESAALSLSEALVLAASQLLDIDFNDIKSGYRIRNSNNKICVDLYLFDSLSSGAGYSSLLTNKIKDLFNLTRELLRCKNHCKTACHDCLEHFWNQRVQSRLDRHLALQLLDWMMYGKLANELSYEEQNCLMVGLKELIKLDDQLEIIYDGNITYVKKEDKKVKLRIYPSMWNEKMIGSSSINISDKLISTALPIAYKKILDKFC